MKKLKSHDFHQKSGFSFKEVRGWTIPAVNNFKKELQAARDNVVLLDRSYLGKILVKGKDGLNLVDRISTNDMKELIVGTACDTVFCTPKGRIVDFVKILQYDNHLLLISSYVGTAHLLEWINRFIILEDVVLEDNSSQFCWFTLIGNQARRFVQKASGQAIVDEDEIIWFNRDGIIFPALLNTNFNLPAYNFCLPVSQVSGIFEWLVQEIRSFGGSLIGDDVFQILRIESGMPDWGTELTEEYNPHEARLLDAVSFTKGCYTGQEVIARLDTYDKVQKYLMIVELNQRLYNQPPFDVFYDNERIGSLTSYAYNPLNDNCVGLAYIKKNLAVADFDILIEVKTGTDTIMGKLKIPPPKSL
jgi:folate-binding protein YgfZ